MSENAEIQTNLALQSNLTAQNNVAHQANTLATIVATKLDSHLLECSRRQTTLEKTIGDIQSDVKGILKWVWIASGVMLAISKGIDFLHH